MVAAVESMAYVGTTPWHGLGTEVDENISLDEFRRQAGLDWEVRKTPVNYWDADHSCWLGFKDKFVLNRSTDQKPFAIVSGRYKPVQPAEVFSFFDDLLRRYNMKMHTAGALLDGGRIWCLAQTGDAHKVLGTDRVEGYLLLSTSYDLSMSTLAQFTSVRVVCNNTLQQALRDSTGRVTIPHVREFDPESIKDQLGIGREQWAAFTYALESIAHIQLDSAKAAQVLDRIFKLPEDPEERMKDSDRVHASNVLQLFTSGRAVGADIAGPTGWGLLNAVTEYTDWHKRARGGQSGRLNNAWFGEGAKLKQDALEQLVLLAA